jgi:hypothetical protein
MGRLSYVKAVSYLGSTAALHVGFRKHVGQLFPV